MTKRVLTTVAGVALLVPALAFAEVQVVNGEAGMIFKEPASALTREQVRTAINAPEDVRGHWRFSNGESGWLHIDTRYVLVHGALVHASDCPVLATLGAPAFRGSMLPVYGGA
jgi:hypothetical protein